ncbi:MAG: hypothetical protein JSS33_07180 [Proteobacteria bacterium]|nr:hypothetical protein [Pseudomonadota bacterium]
MTYMNSKAGRPPHTILIILFVFAVQGCASLRTDQPLSSGPVTAQEFRKLFPLSDNYIDPILRDYNKAQASLLNASRNGARANVVLLTAGGVIHAGHDEFFSGEPVSLKEKRDNYTAVQIGTSFCVETPTSQTSCKRSSPLHLGLVPVEKTHISKAWSRDITCIDPTEPCRFIKIQTGSIESDTNSLEGYSTEPELIGHDYELVITLSNFLPVYFKQTDHYHVGVTATAFYGYNFKLQVKKFSLPEAGKPIP